MTVPPMIFTSVNLACSYEIVPVELGRFCVGIKQALDSRQNNYVDF